ncbi:MAG: biosynthetic arginine decarboxylase [Halobacteriovoraceae bacterium]|nr:biosynthetic arginine decarboxylase [Halobacteriovoraceae bacterium]
MHEWSREEAEITYNISNWGEGYFDINPEGHLVVKTSDDSKPIVIKDVVEEMQSQGVTFPAVLRFHDILRSQVQKINIAFKDCIAEANYQGTYRGVYPVKVNQMREVIEEIVDAGAEYNYGLEAGSKPELLAVLAYNTNKDSLTVLNGYKDEDYLSLALMGNQLGRNVIIVIEKFSELPKLLKVAKKIGVRPQVGLRGKMSIKGRGRWAKSTGDRAKFGLSISEMLKAVNLMKENEMEDCIKLFHFHIGSQISDIRTIKAAINEGARIYTELHKLGCGLEFFDAGGGLGIDYDGSRSDSDSSVNYSLSEYVADIIYGVKQVCDLEKVPHPNIVTESGRAITAHHSMVITKVIDKIKVTQTDFETTKMEDEHILIKNMREMHSWDMTEEKYQEIYNEALQIKDQALAAFNLGVISLQDRATIETLYWQIIEDMMKLVKTFDFIPEHLNDLEDSLSPQYLCNFSVFQSAADHWAIGQLLPVIPISRLNEKPTESCSIADITCDSDGMIGKFINRDGITPTMAIHDIKPDDNYLIGMFLTGAYQDVMGDMHNLFGRVHEVHVYGDSDDPHGFYIEEIIKGNTASSVLSTMQYNPEYMAQKVKRDVTKIVSAGKLPPRRGVKWVDFYEDCLTSYTYLNT